MLSVFNDDYYEILNLSENNIEYNIQENIKNIYHNKDFFGYLFLFNKTTKKDFIGLNIDLKENVICPGIVINEHNCIYDVILKNFISSEPICIPMKYFNNEKYIYAYVKNIFDRYISKYKREATLGIQDINYIIPPIGLLDFILQKIDIYFSTMKLIYKNEDKFNKFKDDFYKYGLIGEYKGKYYQWLPKEDNTREIKNLKALKLYNIIPAFTIQYKI